MKHNRRRGRKRGFTLMEVLLVLAILVILGSMVTVYFVGAQRRGYERAAKAQIGMFERMLTDYRLSVGTFPSTSQGLAALREAPADLADANKWDGPYAAKPIPPDPWGNPYKYELIDADNFLLYSFGADGLDSSGDEVSNIAQ